MWDIWTEGLKDSPFNEWGRMAMKIIQCTLKTSFYFALTKIINTLIANDIISIITVECLRAYF